MGNDQEKAHRISPISPPTVMGGAGTVFEYRFAAVVMVALLGADRVPGLDAPVARVGLQQRFAGHLLDDVVVGDRLTSEEEQTVEYQVKHSLSPTAGDKEFGEVVIRGVAAIREDLGEVVAGPPPLRDRSPSVLAA